MSDEQESTPTEEKVAIVGVGFRLPGCNVDSIDSLEDLKQILSDLKDCISKVPINRWDVENFYDSDPDAIGKTRSTEVHSFYHYCKEINSIII
jgi:acyl transferase domain-containing protein